MASAAAPYYFRFVFHDVTLIEFLKVNVYRHICIHAWDITTSGLEKNNRPPYWNSKPYFVVITRSAAEIKLFPLSAILEFYFQFRFRPYRAAVGMSYCTRLRHFIPVRPPTAEKSRSVDFQDGESPPSWILGVQLSVHWKGHVRHLIDRQ